MTTSVKNRLKEWFADEREKIAKDKVYFVTVILLAVNLAASVAFGLYAEVTGKDKLFFAVAAGFVLITEGIIDYSSELSPDSKKGLQAFKLAYRFLGVVLTVCAVAISG